MLNRMTWPVRLLFVMTVCPIIRADDPVPDEVKFIKEYLGCGYDAVRGEFADAEYVKKRIFSVGTLEDDVFFSSNGFTFRRTNSQSERVTTGKTAKAFAKSLAAEAGVSANEGLYYGEVNANFTDNSTGSTDEAFAVLNATKQIYTAALGVSRKAEPEVLNELNTLDPGRVILKYGTHVNVGLKFGGRIEFTYSEKATRKSNDIKLGALVKGSYEGVSAHASATDKQHREEATQHGKVHLEIHGGRPVALTTRNFQEQSKGGDFIKSQLAEWSDSISAPNYGPPNGDNKSAPPAMVGYLPQGLLPIWKVSGLTSTRAAQLENEVKRYARMHAKGVTDRPLENLATPITRLCNITLKHSTGKHLGGMDDGSDWFPISGNSSLQIHLYTNEMLANQANKFQPLKSGDNIHLAVGVGEQSHKEGHVWLTVQSGNDAYVQGNPHHRKARWQIWLKGSNGQPDGSKTIIRNGDWVAFTNSDPGYEQRYFGPDDDTYWDIQKKNELHWFEIKHR